MTEPAIFVTGATGIVGSATTTALLDRGARVVAAIRTEADASRLDPRAEARLFDFDSGPDAQDIGRVAAAVLTEPGHLRKAYTLSGEQTLGYRKVARILSDVLGREIRYARPGEAEYLARLAEQGAPADYIAVQKMIYRVVRWNISALPNRAVRKLTGRPATTFREFAERDRAAWER